jgi:hypothetical protein
MAQVLLRRDVAGKVVDSFGMPPLTFIRLVIPVYEFQLGTYLDQVSTYLELNFACRALQ